MAAKRTLTEINCGNCGMEFRPAAAVNRFCSSACWYEYTRKRKERPCEICGTTYQAGYAKQRTCSVACGRVLKGRTSRTREYDRNCERCGEPFQAYRGKTRFCSRSCSMYTREQEGRGKTVPIGTKRRYLGYVKVKTDGGWEFEHRLVLAEKIGRTLLPWPQEHVHHRDGDRSNNDPANLELRKGASHGPGASKHCPTCTCELT
jgi:hypothetical protein